MSGRTGSVSRPLQRRQIVAAECAAQQQEARIHVLETGANTSYECIWHCRREDGVAGYAGLWTRFEGRVGRADNEVSEVEETVTFFPILTPCHSLERKKKKKKKGAWVAEKKEFIMESLGFAAPFS